MLLHNVDGIRKSDRGFDFDYLIGNKEYLVQIITNQSIPYVLVVPIKMKKNSMLAVEVNNLESENNAELYENALLTAYNLTKKLVEYDSPVLVPIIPSVHSGIPYFQQLSRECFFLSTDSQFHRIDLQVLDVINSAKEEFFKDSEICDKIFLNGYSSSGVFAQRFALLHPEIVDTLCVGGASGSIPVPITELDYPLGIADFSEITGKDSSFDSYSKIKFRYYVGALEDKRKTSERFDEDGEYAPMHDMSYFSRSVPVDVGMKQRNMFGRNLFERSKRQISLMKELGLDIEQEVFEGRTHNNKNGRGVNELGDAFINTAYRHSCTQSKNL